MKPYLFIVISMLLTFLIVSCEQKSEKGYDIYWDKDNLCVVMEHPTYGIIEINRPNWGKVRLNEVVEDIYDYIRKKESYETVKVWVRFESPLTDKYGNETMTYEDYEIATIPVSEAIKYQSWEFLNQSYNIIVNIEKAAFGDVYYNGESSNLNFKIVNESNQIISEDSIDGLPYDPNHNLYPRIDLDDEDTWPNSTSQPRIIID